jgi:hypothetical protein
MSGPTPATPAELLARLRSQLPAALPTAMRASGAQATAGSDLYEAYLLALLLNAARVEGYGINIRDGNGRPPTVFNLRRSPGRLSSAGSALMPFCHAVLSAPDKPSLEAHTGVAVIGRSRVAHEADLVLLREAEANRCRALGIDPPSRATLLVVEGKYYRRPIGLDIAREFLGLCSDLATPDKALAASIPSPSLVNLLAGRRAQHEVGVLPRRKGEADLLALFGRVLRNYRGRR